MADVDTSILDELSSRNRRAALRQRGAATGRVRAPRYDFVIERTGAVKRARKPKPRWMPKGPDMRNTPEAKTRARESVEARRQREGDEMCEAVLGILQRLNQSR